MRYIVCCIGLSILLFGFTCTAHSIIFSEFTLSQKNGEWELSFVQKTSYLRDAVYDSRPNLRGVNLNSDEFLEATSHYILSNLMLKYEDQRLTLKSQSMKYGGLRFESKFTIAGLPKNPDLLVIRADGFDVHEHSIVLFRVAIEKEAYLNYFNQQQRLATFDFNSHKYAQGEMQAQGNNRFLIYMITILFAIVFWVYLKIR